MTGASSGSRDGAAEPRPSTLPFDPADLVAMRVLPAQFARMVGVSKQAVSEWIRNGKVTLGPDGKLDPAKASREVIENSDPARLRARTLKQATLTHAQLRARIRELQESCEAIEIATRNRCVDEASRKLYRFVDALEAQFDELRAIADSGGLGDALDRLVFTAYYGFPASEYPDDGEPAPSDSRETSTAQPQKEPPA